MARLPHPIPYQGSKRVLARVILDVLGPRPVKRLFEPFAGSAAITLAAAHRDIAKHFVLGDSLIPLIGIWRSILANPTALARDYDALWSGQKGGDCEYYGEIREEFNLHGDPAKLLYLLARCVKNSPRWNRAGLFNQSRDQRRLGMRPDKMARELVGSHLLLRGKTEAVAGDFADLLADAEPCDLVYLDPPWEGTSTGRDKRYHRGLARQTLLAALQSLNERRVPWMLSYDGQCGATRYGAALPSELCATRFALDGGRSTQATLNGRSDVTLESLYVSHSLLEDCAPLSGTNQTGASGKPIRC